MNGRNLIALFIIGLLAIILGIGLGLTLLRRIPEVSTTQSVSTQPSPPSEANTVEIPAINQPSLAPVLKKAIPGVVNVAASGSHTSESNPLLNDPAFKRFLGPLGLLFNNPNEHVTERTQSVGSGVVVDAEKGYVLTNQHLIAKADEIYVVLQDKRRLKAKILGADPDTDIAMLQIQESNLTALPLGDSDKVQVGDFVMAIGNPFGLGNTATFGIVSAVGRNGLGIEGYENFIQTDASINPGNSGGPLINLNGEVIGINTAILSGGGGSLGINFAIPINMARQIMKELVATGKVTHGQIGIGIQDVTPELKSALNLNVDAGALVTQVNKSGPADEAGIQKGDVIVRFDNHDVLGSSDLRVMVGLKAIGDKVEVGLIRNGSPKTVTVTVAKPQETGNVEAKEVDLLNGALFSAIPQTNPRYGKTQGVLVTKVEPNSSAALAGLQEGDIVTAVNQKSVSNIDDLTNAAKARTDFLLLNVQRGDMALYIVIR